MQPAFGTVDAVACGNVQSQKTQREYSNRNAHDICALEIAHPPAGEKKQQYGRHNQKDLFVEIFRDRRSRNGEPERRQVKSKNFNLKPHTVHQAHCLINTPFQNNEGSESQHD